MTGISPAMKASAARRVGPAACTQRSTRPCSTAAGSSASLSERTATCLGGAVSRTFAYRGGPSWHYLRVGERERMAAPVNIRDVRHEVARCEWLCRRWRTRW